MGRRRISIAAETAIVIVALTVAAGCGKGAGAATFRADGLVITMTPPAGWQRGDLKQGGGYTPSHGGRYLFADASKDYPSAEVQAIDLLGDSLSEYVKKSYEEEKKLQGMGAKMTGMLENVAGEAAGAEARAEAEKSRKAMENAEVTMKEFSIGQQKAAEMAVRSEGVRLWVFVEKGAKAAMIVFEGEKDEFAREEPGIRAAIKTITMV